MEQGNDGFSRMRNVATTTTDSWRSYMRDGAPEADMDERGPLHGHAAPSPSSARVPRVLARVFRLHSTRVAAALLLLALGALLVHHWTGPAHALTAEERAQRFLARTERDAGRVPADEAYVTIAASDRDAAGVFALAASLVAARSTRMLRVLVTPDVSHTVRTQLGRLPNVAAVTVVQHVLDRHSGGGGGGADAGARARLARLRVWQLPDLALAVYLDPDVVVRRNTDALFVLRPGAEQLYAAYDTDGDAVCNATGAPLRALNSSVMVLRPSARVFDRLVAAAEARARDPARAAAFTEADVIQAVYEDRESGAWWKPLPRPLYGMSVLHLCVCGPPVVERARVVHFATDAPPVAVGVPGPDEWGRGMHGDVHSPLSERERRNEQNLNATAIYLHGCFSRHHKAWRNFFRNAQKLLL